MFGRGLEVKKKKKCLSITLVNKEFYRIFLILKFLADISDIQPGNICTRNASADECQDGSTCVRATGKVSVLKCTCNAGSHLKTTAAGLLLCEPGQSPPTPNNTNNNNSYSYIVIPRKTLTMSSPRCTLSTSTSTWGIIGRKMSHDVTTLCTRVQMTSQFRAAVSLGLV